VLDRSGTRAFDRSIGPSFDRFSGSASIDPPHRSPLDWARARKTSTRLRARASRSRKDGVPSKRDSFIDGLRAISVLRVISLHLLQRVEHPFLIAFSFLMPGMPLMFFVSGALAAKSLERDEPEARKRFWISRGRRLLFPFWAFGLIVLATCIVGQLLWKDPEHHVALDKCWRWILPLAGPPVSAAYERLNWHLWFLSSLILLLGTAPWTIALHKRAPWSGAIAFFLAGAAIEFLSVPVPDVVRNTLLFGAAFQFGYGFADGRVLRAKKSTVFAAAFCLAAFALAFYARRSPGSMLHAVPLALVSLGLAFVALWLVLRERATTWFERPLAKRCIGAVNRRAYSLYLWGPVANEIAWRVVRPAKHWEYALDFALSIGILFVFVRMLGPVEDWAARRGRTIKLERRAPEDLRRAA
jgi:peptidoglycan/LPS O-acetylase OafA/YrhL